MTTTLTPTTRRLTPSEAEDLWRSWKDTRDVRARDRLVLAYAPMVRFIAARKVRELPGHCDLDDLASSGLVALLEAVDRFDPAKGATFEQYAWTRVAGALVDELRRQDWASRSVRRVGRRIERARDSFFARHGVAPTEEQLARELGMTVAELRVSLEEIERADVASLNAPARGADDSVPTEVGDTVVAPSGDHEPDATALASERNAAMRNAIARLSERERRVLALVHVHELPGAEIGRMLGVSESRVSQILAGIRRKLKDQLAAYDVDVAA
ncbi:MAG TPA: FliA/WhiG family RNA polymerase sigma factor [Gaiellaceae bacterium]|nr:FliA/WhiG family RNA polymerase sigma factor [Gaiellaceae bacterium]